jgi:carbonic anhydrase/acetyltransferase-like protein (isoleucine patch superfamily)
LSIELTMQGVAKPPLEIDMSRSMGLQITVRPGGSRVTIGHQAILHGCSIADDCLIGMGARILNGAVLGPECLVGAGALITEGKRFEGGSLIVGVPARVIRQLTPEERSAIRASAAHYAKKAARYASGLRAV